MYRYLSLLLALLTLSVSGVCHYVISGFGFPDGHVTELEHAFERIAKSWYPIATVAVGYLLYLFWVGRQVCIRRRLAIMTVFLALVCVSVVVLRFYLMGQLDDGRGG